MSVAQPRSLWTAPDESEVPEEMLERANWVCWDRPVGDKTPLNPRSWPLRFASNKRPADWASFQAAVATARRHGLGLAFVFVKDCGFFGLDLDNVRNPLSGALLPGVEKFVRRLNTYTEVSPSGTGLHLVVMARPTEGPKRYELRGGGRLEIKDHHLCLAITADRVPGTPLSLPQNDELLPSLFATHCLRFGETAPPPEALAQGRPLQRFPDDQVLAMALSAKNGRKLTRLMAGQVEDYPSASEADLALCVILAFWTRDPDQIDRIFRRSCLFTRRNKWDKSCGDKTYGSLTIATALKRQTTCRWWS